VAAIFGTDAYPHPYCFSRYRVAAAFLSAGCRDRYRILTDWILRRSTAWLSLQAQAKSTNAI
jgi:hypothetical protein